MKRLAEWINVSSSMSDSDALPVELATTHANLSIEHMIASWGIAYAELSVLLVYLRSVALVHQTNHWITRGDSFYGDHLLFQRLYDKANEEIDAIAERVVGLGSEQNVNLRLQLRQLQLLMEKSTDGETIPGASDLVKKSLNVEKQLVSTIDALISSLDEQGMLTTGLRNMLEGLADVHEGHVYLLKQRCAQTTMGF